MEKSRKLIQFKHFLDFPVPMKGREVATLKQNVQRITIIQIGSELTGADILASTPLGHG